MELVSIVALVVYMIGVVSICRFALRLYRHIKSRIVVKADGDDG